MDELLTVDETAALLRTSRKAVYTLAERAALPGIVRVGRRLLFSRAALRKHLGLTTPPPAAHSPVLETRAGAERCP
jgi:excisionase family DNA binding protein